MRLLAFTVLLAGCGRIGFGGAGGGDDVAPDQVAVDVVTDTADVPVANAAVLIDRGDGTFDRVATDADGRVTLHADAPTTLHIIYPDTTAIWRVFTIQSVPPGTAVHLGGRPTVEFTSSMTVGLPAAGANDQYYVTAGMCGYSAYTAGTNVGLIYVPACEGTSVHVFAFSRNATTHRGFDAGQVTLVRGSTRTLNGVYTTMPTYTINASNLPAGSVALYASIANVANGDYTIISDGGSATVTGPSGQVSMPALDAGNALILEADGGLIGAYESTSYVFRTDTISQSMQVDASSMLPLMTLALAPDARSATWTENGASTQAPVMRLFDSDFWSGSAVTTRWTAYLPPSATSVQFPNLPADLGGAAPASGTWDNAQVVAIAVPLQSYQTMLANADHAWPLWLRGSSPATNIAYSEVLYTVALGPP